PTTAIDGAGFIVGSGALGSYIPTTSGPSQYEKKEERTKMIKSTIEFYNFFQEETIFLIILHSILIISI
ncbi:unnamed protein product, partial [Rotaria sp. Silwood1]